MPEKLETTECPSQILGEKREHREKATAPRNARLVPSSKVRSFESDAEILGQLRDYCKFTVIEPRPSSYSVNKYHPRRDQRIFARWLRCGGPSLRYLCSRECSGSKPYGQFFAYPDPC